MSKTFKGKVVWITGGASGIGAACCTHFAEQGAQVVCTDIQTKMGEALQKKLAGAGHQVAFYEQDVTSEQRWIALAETVLADFGKLHVLVNNAGIGEGGPILESTLESFRRIFAVNVESIFLGTRTCIPLIDQSGGGSIINISSVAGLRGAANLSAYCGTKGAVRLYTKATALECAGQGYKVRCNSVHPGIIETPIWAAVVPSEESITQLQFAVQMQAEAGGAKLPADGTNMSVPSMIAATSVPGGAVGLPIDIAKAVAFLAGDGASYINGSELVVDSALTAKT